MMSDMKRRIGRAAISMILTMVMVLGLLAPVNVTTYAAGTVYLAFSSDVHNNGTKTGSNSSAERLNNWINTTSDKLGGATFEVMGFCGDNGDAYQRGDDFWSSVQDMMDVVEGNTKVKTGIFTAGNHEWYNGSIGSTSNPVAQKIQILGEAANTSDYIIYCFGATSQNSAYKQEDINNLDSYLQTAPTDRPIFIMTHFPLHSYSSRTTEKAADVISMLNKNAETHQIIYLWGHNHTLSDTNYDKVITDKISDTAIKFTYAAAGCMSDSEYGSGSASVKGKGMAVTIEANGDITMTYYTADGSVVASGKAQKPGTSGQHQHSYDDGKVTKEASCVAEGERTYTCSCGATRVEPIAKNPANHTGETVVKNAKDASAEEEGYTGDTYCKGCDVKLADGQVIPKLHVHDYGEGVVTVVPTCAAEGQLTFTCECGDILLEATEKDPENHVGEAEVRDAKEATVDEEGYTGDIYCSACGALLEAGQAIPKVHVHNYGEGIVSKMPSCAGEGEVIYTCECGDRLVEVMDMNPDKHLGKTDIADQKSATIDAKGYSGDTICVDCGAIIAKGKKTDKVTSLSLYAGKTLTVPVKGTASEWKTSNKSVVTVSAKGRLKGVKAGNASVTCKIGKKTYTVSVKVKKCKVTVDASAISVKKGKTYQLTAKATPKAAITWSSSNSKIASVSETGLVKGKKKGTCTIYASANGVSKAVTVTVK